MKLPIPETFKPQPLFVVYLEWDHADDDIGTTIYERIAKFKSDGMLISDQMAGACWSYNLTIMGKTERATRLFAEKVLRLLRRRKADLYYLSGLIN
jgi:CO dehydrogenase/acetyl-CoA synthase alpha subunit